jgi:phosphatidate cytidylyltransferase
VSRCLPILCVSPVGIRANSTAANGAARTGLKQRVLTALVLVPLLLGCMFLLPNSVWALLMCVPAALAALEWSRLAGYRRSGSLLFTAAVIATCLGFLLLGAFVPPLTAAAARAAVLLYVLALLFWAIVVPLWLYRGWRAPQPLLLGAVGWIVLVPAWLAIVSLQKTASLLLAALLAVWIADIAAYFAGRRYGRRKLAPQISPGKTWEGVCGALIAISIYGFGVSFLLQPAANIYDRMVMLIFFVALTVLGIVGDLFESWIKRGAGVKDSGNLLPGHGGMLDRIDSLTAALPFAALYFLPLLQ